MRKFVWCREEGMEYIPGNTASCTTHKFRPCDVHIKVYLGPMTPQWAMSHNKITINKQSRWPCAHLGKALTSAGAAKFELAAP